ncbi:hypothetical protein [Streptomyces vietnamensis]|uniref:hypothetical protein n=1 Tax=Streptomyces vietnamensis TaxID=362257 RepID=UPI0034326D85
MSPGESRRTAAGVLLLIALVGGCAGAAEPPARTASQQAPEIERDRKPVERRFPQFGNFTGVAWAAAPLGVADSRVPGPTDVRMSGVVTLAKADVRRLLKEYHWAPAEELPDVLGSVAPRVPAGAAWRTSEAFTSAVTGEAYSASFHLDPVAGVMVFDAVDPTAVEGS